MVNIVLMGVSGSGKSTVGNALAQQLNVVFHDGDSFHSAANREKMAAGKSLTDEDREPWLDSLARVLEEKSGVIVACSALKYAYRRKLRGGSDENSQIAFIHLVVPEVTLMTRLVSRSNHYFPAQVSTLEEAHESEKIHEVENTQPLQKVLDDIKNILLMYI